MNKVFIYKETVELIELDEWQSLIIYIFVTVKPQNFSDP